MVLAEGGQLDLRLPLLGVVPAVEVQRQGRDRVEDPLDVLGGATRVTRAVAHARVGVNPELCGHKDNSCDSACVKKNIEKVNKANKATEEYFRKKRQKEAKKLYNYFFKPSKCFGNPVLPLPKYDTCYTQAEIDSDKQLLKTVMSAFGDMTMLEPWYQCAFNHNQDKCDTLGMAMSSADAGGVARGATRFIGAMSKAGRILCSFTSSTRVLLKGGGTKHRDTDLVDLRVSDKQGRAVTVNTTSEHPFWDATAHAWIQAGKLTAGHDLSTADNGRARLVGVRLQAGGADRTTSPSRTCTRTMCSPVPRRCWCTTAISPSGVGGRRASTVRW